VSWLTFRRTLQTWADQERVSPRTIADIVGHANVATQQLYIQPVQEAQREAIEKVTGDLHELCTKRPETALPMEQQGPWVN
jgi:hypothetical protein